MADGRILLYLGLYWLGCASAYMQYNNTAFWLHIIFASIALIGYWFVETFIKENKKTR